MKTMDQPQPHPRPVDPLTVATTHGGEIKDEQLTDGKGHGRDGHAQHADGHAGGHADEKVIPDDLPRPGAMTILLLVAGFAVLLLALFFVGLIPSMRQDKEVRADAAEHANEAPIVSTTQPVSSATSKDLFLPADVKAFQDTSLFPRTSGYLKKQYVDIQDHVKAGDVLAEIDTPEVDAQLAQSRAALEQSKAAVVTNQSNLDLAQKTLNRYWEAQKTSPGSITQEDLDTRVATRDQAVAALAQSKANVVAAEADVQRNTVLQGFEKVYAPFTGTVTFRGFDLGALLTSGSTGNPLFRLQETDILRVWVNVPQAYSSQLVVGEKTYLKVRNYGEREFEGIVARTAASLDPATRTMQFELDFPNPQGLLYPGMYAQARLVVGQSRPVLVVPSSAMIFDANGTQVAVVKDSKAHFQKVTIGRDLGTQLEIIDGLSADDQVITNPGLRLIEGSEVQINSPGPKTQTAAQPAQKPQAERVAEKS